MLNKIDDVKINSKIVDTWYSRVDFEKNWGIGIVQEIKNNKIKVLFSNSLDSKNKIIIYDRSHFELFTRKVDRRLSKWKEVETNFLRRKS